MPSHLVAATVAGASAALGVLAYGTFAPRSRLWGRILSRAADASADGRPAGVALTFDDGPTPGGTDRVLDVLRAEGVPAAFFVVGRNVDRWPDLVRRMDAEGHVVGNHTYDHSHYGICRAQWYWDREVVKGDAAIERAIGRRPAMFRPPMGFKTGHVTLAARKRGLATVTWSRRAVDGVPTTPGRILDRLAASTGPGDVVLLHDGIEPHARRRDPSATAGALPPLIAALRGRGLVLERLDRLLGLPAYQA